METKHVYGNTWLWPWRERRNEWKSSENGGLLLIFEFASAAEDDAVDPVCRMLPIRLCYKLIPTVGVRLRWLLKTDTDTRLAFELICTSCICCDAIMIVHLHSNYSDNYVCLLATRFRTAREQTSWWSLSVMFPFEAYICGLLIVLWNFVLKGRPTVLLRHLTYLLVFVCYLEQH